LIYAKGKEEMVKITRRSILAIVLALTMAMTMFGGLLASANEPPETPAISITIPASANLTFEGQRIELFRVFDVTFQVINGRERFAYTITPEFRPFQEDPANAAFLGQTGVGASARTRTLHEFILALDRGFNDPDMIILAEMLREFAGERNIAPVAFEVGAPGQRTIVFEDLPLGYYLVGGAGYVASQSSEPPPVPPETVMPVPRLVTVYKDEVVEITLKADAPTIDKEIYNDHPNLEDCDYCDDECAACDGWGRWTDGSIGDVVQFRVTTTVPNMVGYSEYVFTVHDVLSPGLTFRNDVRVQIVAPGPDGARRDMLLGTEYTVTILPPPQLPEPQVTRFSIAFVPEEFIKLTPGSTIYIFYSATINQNAIIEIPGNDNLVRLEYSRNPYDTSQTNYTPWSRVKVFTGRLGFIKVDEYDILATLPNAEFELWEIPDDPDSALWFTGPEVVIDDTVPVNVYRVMTPAQIQAVIDAAEGATEAERRANARAAHVKLVTPASGRVLVEGLGSGYTIYGPDDDILAEHRYGYYWLVETKAPDGFHLRPDPIPVQVRIVDVIFDGELFDPDDEAAWNIIVDETDPGLFWHVVQRNLLGIRNFADPLFPETGGIGRTMFIFGGVALMGFAVIGLVATTAVKKKKAVTD